MMKPYHLHNASRALLLWLLLLAGALGVRAQSGPYGNEWIVPGQPYYKLKTWRDGIYRLDYAYLSQLSGATGVAPTQLQLWRRGKEVAVYQGGNGTALDNSTYLEFFGQRNDATLDVELYKNRQDQSNPHYAFYSDTAAYFITWGSRAGKRMAQPTATGGTPHAWRLQVSLAQFTDTYAQNPEEGEVHLPWLQKGEGFFSGIIYFAYNGKVRIKLDSVLRAISPMPGAPAPRLDITVQGGYNTTSGHITGIGVLDPNTGTIRELDQVQYKALDFARRRYILLPTDVDKTGQVTLDFKALGESTTPPFDIFRVSWLTVTVPQQNVWFSDRRLVRFANDSTLGGPATYEVDNIPNTVVGYDVQDPWNVQRIAAAPAQTLGNTARRFVFPSATDQQMRDLLLFDANKPMVPPVAQHITFRNYAVADANYFIITHPQLMKGAGNVPSAARAYAAYRASAAGGRYDTLVAQAPRLYDQFHYGERSVMALRNFSRWAAASSKASNKYLLLLGRAIEPGLPATDSIDYDNVSGNFGNPTKYATRVLGERGLDLVPTTSQSPSDTFLSDDWPNADFVPTLATGRVPALTPTEVITYLDKLKDYESQLDPNNPNPDSWHKNVLHLVGGENQVRDHDFDVFGGILDRYRVQLEHPLLGASVTTFRRTTEGGEPVAVPGIVPLVNAGLLKISYFGHGSPSYLDLNPPAISNPANGYRNLHKYPIFEINGCAAANCFFIGRTIVTDWLFTPNVGAIGLAAQTGSAYTSLLDPAQHLTNQLSFNDPLWFGMPVGDIRREVIRRLQHESSFQYGPGYSTAGTEQLMCTMWHGDPALRLFAPAKPDFVVSNSTLAIRSIAPETEVNANSAQFTLAVGVSNPGRITYDSLEIQVTRTILGTGEKRVYKFSGTDKTQFRQAFRRDTTYTLTLPNVGNVFGDNTFEVFVDFRNKVAELSETNNKATLTYSFLRPGFTLLSPTEFAIVRTQTPRLAAQNNDVNSPVRGYEVQVDSVASFDSANGQPLQSQTLRTGSLVSFTPTPLQGKAGRDSVVWYWRMRFTTPVGAESPAWQTASFRVVSTATAGGWSQSHNGQFNRDQLDGVAVSTPGNRWSFTPQSLLLVLRTIGGGAKGSGPTYNVANGYGIQTDASAAPDVSTCTNNAPDLLVTVLDEHTLQRIPISGTYTTCGKGDQTFYQFAASNDSLSNLNNSADVRNRLLAFLQNVPDGAYVLLVSENRLRYTNPDLAPVLQTLAKQLGSKLLGSLKDGDPFALVGQKNTAGGRLVAEQGPDRTSSTPANVQPINLSTAVSTAGQSGTVLSTRIGPAKEWLTLYDVFERPLSATASYKLELLGIDAANNQTVLNGNVQTKQLDLSGYATSQYPYLQLRLTLKDSVNRVPPQLREWFVTYHGIPEGVALRDANRPAAYDAISLKNQAINGTGTVSFPVKFDNVSQEPFVAPLKYKVELISVTTGLPLFTSQLLDAPRAPAAGDSAVTITVKLDLANKYGTYYPQVTVNPPQPVGQPEQYYFNNVVRLPAFTVPNTNIAPVLDVAVDGRHILSGEPVSPTPVIDIQLKDADTRRFLNQPTYFSVYLQSPGALVPVAVDVTGPQVRFSVDSTSTKGKGSVARLEYLPGLGKPLADGVYTLRVQGRNPNGNTSGSVDFEVKFEVVNASTITNVFPYPNPVTSKAKFVFTVTGQELPRNMKIQIMTLTGRVVREIFMNELGPLHIGNNITDYAWDGTDQYGDRLANGTYLYRVSLDDASGQFGRRTTAADQAFKNDWGKLVLLR